MKRRSAAGKKKKDATVRKRRRRQKGVIPDLKKRSEMMVQNLHLLRKRGGVFMAQLN